MGQNPDILPSFVAERIDDHPHDIVTLMDQDGIELRGGHHCAQPTMIRYCVPATARASISFYNKFEELDALAESLKKAAKLFAG